MNFESGMPFGAFAAIVCLVVVAYVCVRFYVRLIENRINGLDCFVLGFCVFQLFDVAKFQVMGHVDRPIEGGTQLLVTMYVVMSLAIVLLTYRLTKVVPTRLVNPVPFGRVRISMVMQAIVPAALAVMPVHLVTYEAQEKTGYLSLIGHGLKGVVLFLFILFLLTKRRILLLVSVLGLLVSLTDTSRRALVVVILPLVILYIDSARISAGRTMVRRATFVAMSLLSLFVFLNYMRAEHDFGEGYVEGDKIENTINYIKTLRSIDTFYNTAFVVEKVPEMFDYFYGSTYAALAVSPIPREMWAEKPYSLGAPLGSMLMFGDGEFDFDRWMSSGMYSLSPGFVGEAYANFGILGVVLVSAIAGFLLKRFDSWILSAPRGQSRLLYRDRVAYVIFLPGFVLLGRGDLYAAMIYPVYVFVFLKFMLWILRLFGEIPVARSPVSVIGR